MKPTPRLRYAFPLQGAQVSSGGPCGRCHDVHPQAALRYAFPQGAQRPRGTLWALPLRFRMSLR